MIAVISAPLSFSCFFWNMILVALQSTLKKTKKQSFWDVCMIKMYGKSRGRQKVRLCEICPMISFYFSTCPSWEWLTSFKTSKEYFKRARNKVWTRVFEVEKKIAEIVYFFLFLDSTWKSNYITYIWWWVVFSSYGRKITFKNGIFFRSWTF